MMHTVLGYRKGQDIFSFIADGCQENSATRSVIIHYAVESAKTKWGGGTIHFNNSSLTIQILPLLD